MSQHFETGAAEDFSLPTGRRTAWQDLWQFPPLWAALAFGGFYAALPHFPVQRELLTRYCASHPIEYATIAMFFLGMATLAVQAIKLIQERAGLKKLVQMLSDVSRQQLRTTSENVAAIRSMLKQQPAQTWDTTAGRCVLGALRYQAESEVTDRLDDHLRHLADLEAEQATQRLGMVGTVTWAVPIIGFLGTVMGITLAIANITPEQLNESLPQITGGLAVAFDTTALSLVLSMGLVFSNFLVKQSQDKILVQVDQQIGHPLCFLLKKTVSHANPLLKGQEETSQQLVQATAQIVTEATQLWRGKLQQLEQSFAESLQAEQLRVAEVLQSSVRQTLSDHQSTLADMRSSESQQQAQLASQIGQAMARWESSLEKSSEHFQVQSQELRQHSQLIISLVDKQQELAVLQKQIHQSLDSSQIAATLDQTLNSLTAAIQLLNARTNSLSRAA